MVQKQQVRKTTPVIETVPEAVPQAGPEQPKATPWLIGALIFTTLAFLALAGWTTYQRYHRTAAEDVVQHAVTAWDAATPAALADAYAPDAVVVEADGTRVVGIKAIVTDARGKGPAFSLTRGGRHRHHARRGVHDVRLPLHGPRPRLRHRGGEDRERQDRPPMELRVGHGSRSIDEVTGTCPHATGG